jgi:hypothetical protein
VEAPQLPTPAGNANYAWAQHSIHHLAGLTDLAPANGSMESNQSGGSELWRQSSAAKLSNSAGNGWLA